MSVPGPKRKSAAVKQATANPGKRPFIAGEIKPSGSVLKPKFLKGRASQIWDQYSAELIRLGTLASIDAHMFALFCNELARYEKDANSFTAADKRELRALGSDFGMGSSARTRIAPPDDKKPEDKTENYF